MYGYVRPLKSELKVREYEAFKSVYCGLCHSLRERYGIAASFVVNFDFTFMAMLLSEADKPCQRYRRCLASPFRRKCCHCQDPALNAAADYSVILAWYKLKDSVRDDGFWKKLRSRVCLLLLMRAYRRAAKNADRFEACVRENLDRLSKLEAEESDSLDAAADCFASVLCAAAGPDDGSSRARILAQILYHTGRIVYVLDAADDLPEDVRTGNYNPLVPRFQLKDGKLPDTVAESLDRTLCLSENALRAAFELLPENPWTSILKNIIYEGLPWVKSLVLQGKWREIRNIRKEIMNGAEV